VTIVARLRSGVLARRMAPYRTVYETSPEAVPGVQLARLNEGWAFSLQRSPWARDMKQRLGLPVRFDSWASFEAAVPVQGKPALVETIRAAAAADEPVIWRSTGGTTAEPFRFPVFPSEAAEAALDIWLGRARLGIGPNDRLFMIWGLSHLFGVGAKGVIAKIKRRLSDWALGYTRWSAYQLSAEALDRACTALTRSHAAYVVGYSSALDRFARQNLSRMPEIHRLKLRAVIATAEGFPSSDSRERVEACFGAPVVMEYGSVETGPIAYERRGGGYDVFWPHHRLELGPRHEDGTAELIVTSLHPRALPLLRYAIGDRVRPGLGADDWPAAFAAVTGRCNDAVIAPGGRIIHSEAFTHVLRDLQGVRRYQVVRRGDLRPPMLRLEADEVSDATVALIRSRLAKIDPLLADSVLERVDGIQTSIAGKHRMVVDEV
jgi:phenylacetate-coenzyme A ligase PaaK-like adenylate-forming protein